MKEVNKLLSLYLSWLTRPFGFEEFLLFLLVVGVKIKLSLRDSVVPNHGGGTQQIPLLIIFLSQIFPRAEVQLSRFMLPHQQYCSMEKSFTLWVRLIQLWWMWVLGIFIFNYHLEMFQIFFKTRKSKNKPQVIVKIWFGWSLLKQSYIDFGYFCSIYLVDLNSEHDFCYSISITLLCYGWKVYFELIFPILENCGFY